MWVMIPSLDRLVQDLVPVFTEPTFHTHCQLLLGWLMCLSTRNPYRVCQAIHAELVHPLELRAVCRIPLPAAHAPGGPLIHPPRAQSEKNLQFKRMARGRLAGRPGTGGGPWKETCWLLLAASPLIPQGGGSALVQARERPVTPGAAFRDGAGMLGETLMTPLPPSPPRARLSP
jgi:hypothetical protein